MLVGYQSEFTRNDTQSLNRRANGFCGFHANILQAKSTTNQAHNARVNNTPVNSVIVMG